MSITINQTYRLSGLRSRHGPFHPSVPHSPAQWPLLQPQSGLLRHRLPARPCGWLARSFLSSLVCPCDLSEWLSKSKETQTEKTEISLRGVCTAFNVTTGRLKKETKSLMKSLMDWRPKGLQLNLQFHHNTVSCVLVLKPSIMH